MKNLLALVLTFSAADSWSGERVDYRPFAYINLRDIRLGAAPPATPDSLPAYSPSAQVWMNALSNSPYEVVLAESSSKIFSSKGGTQYGHFEKFSAAASIDKNDLSKTEIFVTLDVTSAVSDYWLLSNKHLKRKLKAEQFPASTLKSLAIIPTATAGLFKIDAELNLMGQTYRKMIETTVVPIEDGKIRASGFFEMTVDGDTATQEFDLVLKPVR